jgi:hypothetical protein
MFIEILLTEFAPLIPVFRKCACYKHFIAIIITVTITFIDVAITIVFFIAIVSIEYDCVVKFIHLTTVSFLRNHYDGIDVY